MAAIADPPGSPGHPVAIPARAIRARLVAAMESPAWAMYLPAEFSGAPPSPDSSKGPRHSLQPELRSHLTSSLETPNGSRPATPYAHHGFRMMEPVNGHDYGFVASPDYSMSARSSPAGTTMGKLAHASLTLSAPTTPMKGMIDLEAYRYAHVAPLTSPLVGNVRRLSFDHVGCRQVQRALDVEESLDMRIALAHELQGHVWEAIRCPHANHVIQKCIMSVPPHASQFVIDELVNGGPGFGGGIAQAARHRYGCRVVERLIERCTPSQLNPLVSDLITEAMSLSKHPYGNYVMQHLLQHGTEDHRHRLTRILEQHAHVAGSDTYARAVVNKALTYGAREDQVSLARALLRQPGLLATMARTRHGHVAARFALQQLDGTDRAEACRQLSTDEAALRASRYGRFVAACLSAAVAEGGSRSLPEVLAHGALGGG